MAGRIHSFSPVAVMLAASLAGAAFAQQQDPQQAPQTVPRQPRVVSPKLFAPPQIEPSQLQRVEPRPPLSNTLGLPPTREQVEAARPVRKPDPLFFRPVAEAAGIITAGGRTITLAGIAPTAADQVCDRPDGGTWPCGTAARTAFRGLLRGRAVRCDLPEGEVADEVTASCHIGSRDIADWLVANGWATASDATYAEQGKLASEHRRGMYGDGPSALPSALSDDPVLPSLGPAAPEGGSISILPSTPDEADEADAPGEAGPVIRGGVLPPPSAPVR